MAIFYVAHAYDDNLENIERAKKIVLNLQLKDFSNTYICPLLAFSYLKSDKVGYDNEINARLDLLSVCDKFIIASNITHDIIEEIDFANLVNMEVEYLEDPE